MSELIKCPFCGGEAAPNSLRTSDRETIRLNGQDEFYGVNCVRCGANNRGVLGHKTREAAAEHWNTRATGDVEYALRQVHQLIGQCEEQPGGEINEDLAWCHDHVMTEAFAVIECVLGEQASEGLPQVSRGPTRYRSLIALMQAYEKALDHNPFLWFEIGYTRPTDWMVHAWDKTGGQERTVVETQGTTLDDACNRATAVLRQLTERGVA